MSRSESFSDTSINSARKNQRHHEGLYTDRLIKLSSYGRGPQNDRQAWSFFYYLPQRLLRPRFFVQPTYSDSTPLKNPIYQPPVCLSAPCLRCFRHCRSECETWVKLVNVRFCLANLGTWACGSLWAEPRQSGFFKKPLPSASYKSRQRIHSSEKYSYHFVGLCSRWWRWHTNQTRKNNYN